MEAAAGLACLILYVLTAYPLYRLMRGQRPLWLRRELNAEYLLLAHIALLLAGSALTLQALLA
jgi:hypothetical protein